MNMNIVVAHNLKVLVISGSMGSGKTTVLGEASDLLAAAEILHAAIDLDTLALGHLPAAASHDLLVDESVADQFLHIASSPFRKRSASRRQPPNRSA